MKNKYFAILTIIALVLTLTAGCAGSSGGDLFSGVAPTDNPVIVAPSDDTAPTSGDVETDSATLVETSDNKGADEDLSAEQAPTESSGSSTNSHLDVINDILENKPDTDTDPERESGRPPAAEKPEPPILISGEYFGSGIDAKFSLSIIIPLSAFDFQGSYHGSGEVFLEISYRDVGGFWLDWEEQKVDIWRIERTTQALSFLYPAVNMIPRTEFRVKLTYRYIVDSGDEYIVSSAWSETADTMPNEPPADGSEAFVGQWHSMNMLAAGWDERYVFHADGTYIYATSQINIDTTIIYMFGTWSVYNGGLAMFVESILSMEGAQIIHDENLGDYLKGGEPVLTVVEYPERSMCQIERGEIDPATGRRTIKINGETWYNFDEHDEYSSFLSEYDYYMAH